MHRLPLPASRLALSCALTLLAACTPGGNGGGGDCRDGDDPCANGFICAAVSADSYECRSPCNNGACPIGQVCDPFFEACVPGEAGPLSDRGVGGQDQGVDGDADPPSDGGVMDRDAAGPDATVLVDGSVQDGSVGDLFVEDAFVQDAFVQDAFVQDAFVQQDAAVDAEVPGRLLEGSWRLELALPACNPVTFLLEFWVQADGRARLNAVRNFCDDAPCTDEHPRAFRTVDESTNDIDVQVMGDRVRIEVFGGLPLTFEASPYGVAGDLYDLTIDGELSDEGLLCGTADLRLGLGDEDAFEFEGVPMRMLHVGEWVSAAPDFETILGCGR